jgi:putative transposase
MVNYRRNRVAGGTFFFTANLFDRRKTLLVDHIDLFRNIITEVKLKLPFTIDAMIVLPDHWHAVWTLPSDDDDYAERIRLIKARFSKEVLQTGITVAKDDRGEYKLWQKRYWEHTIRDDRDFEAHVNYVHINPVKHSYVARAVDWPHSTIHRYVKNGMLPADWACNPEIRDFGER